MSKRVVRAYRRWRHDREDRRARHEFLEGVERANQQAADNAAQMMGWLSDSHKHSIEKQREFQKWWRENRQKRVYVKK